MVVLFIFGVYHFRTQLGIALWNQLHLSPQVMLTLNTDAVFVVEIGNYYFNVYGDDVYDLKKAEKYFKKAIQIDPQVPDAWHQLARIDFLHGDFDSALYKINKQIEIHGDNFMASYYIRGLIHGFRKESEMAESDFLMFLEWDPINWAARNDLAWVYFEQARYEDTFVVAERGIEYFPNNPWLLNIAGASLLNLERYKEAEIFLSHAFLQAEQLTNRDWEKAYPGNDPRIASQGLAEMKEAIKRNLSLVVNK